MAIAYESMDLGGCQKGQPTHNKELMCRSALLEDVATLFGVAQSIGLYGQCVLKIF